MNQDRGHAGLFWQEDNLPDVFLIQEALDQEGLACRLETIDDGDDVLSFIDNLEANPHLRCPDLFVVDLKRDDIRCFQTAPSRRQIQRTGIGLAIRQRVVERYGRRIRVASRPEKEQPSSLPSPKTYQNPEPQPLILLLAEDNLPDAPFLREAIKTENPPLEVHIAPDGEQAVGASRKRPGHAAPASSAA
jgi:hypothetical protein